MAFCMQNHREFLLKCIELASTRLGFCAPNPAVGCVVVKNNKIIAEGFHLGCGHPHAEVDALNKLNDDLHGATLYVSLEPCCHYGRTPPCTERIKKSGVKKVIFGLKDPNPIVAGKGQSELINAGIECESIELLEINNFYRAYSYWTKTKMPFVTAKLAMSKDHKIAMANKSPVKISGKECDQLTHQYRKSADAIFTSIETIICDNPQLNARINNSELAKNIYILDSHCRLPLHSKIFHTAKSITVFHSKNADLELIEKLQNKSVRCISVSEKNVGLDLKECLEKIGADGVHHLWIEAGSKCFNAFLKQNLLNQIILYVSSMKLGNDALPANIDIDVLLKNAKNSSRSTLGNDTVYIIEQNKN